MDSVDKEQDAKTLEVEAEPIQDTKKQEQPLPEDIQKELKKTAVKPEVEVKEATKLDINQPVDEEFEEKKDESKSNITFI